MSNASTIKGWDTYSRRGIDLASSIASFGFGAAKAGTRLGFAATRTVAGFTVGLTTTVVDHAIFGGGAVTRPLVGGAVSSVISLVEQLTLAPIHISEYITSTSLIAAHGSINVLSVFFPGSSDASFSLASFIGLVRREWSQPGNENVPEKRYGITQTGRAIVGWVVLQGVTQEWQEKNWFKHLKEIHVNKAALGSHSTLARKNSRVRVTSDVIFPGNSGQLIAASIGEARERASSLQSVRSSTLSILSMSHTWNRSSDVGDTSPTRPSNSELKTTLRRLSKIVLAGYGGPSLLFFGVYPGPFRPRLTSSAAEMASEEAQLASAIDASEAEASGDSRAHHTDVAPDYSWWDVLLGKHDQEIFERAADAGIPGQRAKHEIKAKISATAVSGREHMMPRYWVLTDHGRNQVVLVLRGTMSLNEIAADLTCDAEEFEPATTTVVEDGYDTVPGRYPFPSMSQTSRVSTSSSTTSRRYYVHSGMLRMARAMGDIGKPVHLAVQEALHSNPDYDLVMCGHSLGAGVVAILGMKWADPMTCLTVHASGLPPGRRVLVYCFAPPALTDAALSKLADRLIVSFVYSHDIVSRLSLGSVRDLRNAALWLCEAENKHAGEGWTSVTRRAEQWKSGGGTADDPHWFIAMRKTLEANMQMSNLFPPGYVLWAMRNSDLHPTHRSQSDLPRVSRRVDELRLFEVLDVEKVFSQIVFSRDMLKAHMPHQYDQVLHDLL